jgi:AcrR family transcriptional regulator
MTEKEKEQGTREKILKVANELFAKSGFDGTSIRDIATKAEVNVAAINYHFENKEKLYCHLFEVNYLWMKEGIEKIGEDESLSLADFTWKIFNFFVENGSSLMNSFKIFLTNSVEINDDICGGGDDFGPPGKEAFLKVLTREVGEEVSFEKRHWAMRMIFANIVHFSVMMQTPMFRKKALSAKFFSPEENKRSIYMLVEALVHKIT